MHVETKNDYIEILVDNSTCGDDDFEEDEFEETEEIEEIGEMYIFCRICNKKADNYLNIFEEKSVLDTLEETFSVKVRYL